MARQTVHDRALILPPVSSQDDVVIADRQSLRRKHQLHRGLVHADRGGQHAGADVGDVREFQQPLNGAVFAVRAVKHRKHHVESETRHDNAVVATIHREQRVPARMSDEMRLAGLIGELGFRLDHVRRLHHRRRAARERPAPVLLDPNRDRFVAIGIEVLKHSRG